MKIETYHSVDIELCQYWCFSLVCTHSCVYIDIMWVYKGIFVCRLTDYKHCTYTNLISHNISVFCHQCSVLITLQTPTLAVRQWKDAASLSPSISDISSLLTQTLLLICKHKSWLWLLLVYTLLDTTHTPTLPLIMACLCDSAVCLGFFFRAWPAVGSHAYTAQKLLFLTFFHRKTRMLNSNYGWKAAPQKEYCNRYFTICKFPLKTVTICNRSSWHLSYYY